LSIVPRIYRQVCSNGLHAWVADYTRAVAVKHTQNAENRFITNAKEILEQEVAYFERFKQASFALARKQMSSLEIDNFLNELFKANEKEEVSTRAKNQMQEIKDLAFRGKGQDIDGVKGTAWAVYNGVTEYVDHYRSSRGSDENREFSSDFGSGAQLRERAFELLTK
jgi:phage/plasmid-like protein (TIGR03299 family)